MPTKTKPTPTMPIHSPLAVANYLLKKGEELDQLKLLKLVYLCHGWHLGKFGVPLVDETVQAWPYGPVFASIYRETESSGNLPVKFPLNNGEVAKLTRQQKALVDSVYAKYNHLSGGLLMYMSHSQGTPWYKVWAKGDTDDAPIPNRLIKRHYEAKATRDAPPSRQYI